MNFYKSALWLSAASVIFLGVIIFSPSEYMVLKWDKLVFSAGILFPLLLFSWIGGLLAIALNFVYSEKLFIEGAKPIRRGKKYLPSFLSIPAVLSFCWFCYKFLAGFSGH